MRTLKFIVEGQKVRPDENCDFSNLVPGSTGYLNAEFSFSSEWKTLIKGVNFYSSLGRNVGAKVLKDGKSCIIPQEALTRRVFKLQLVGTNAGKSVSLRTNKLAVSQNGG